HDLGKFSPGFQALRADLAVELLGEPVVADVRRVRPVPGTGRTDTPHGSLTGFHLDGMVRSWGADPSFSSWLAWALGGHHGYFQSAETRRQARDAINDHGGPRWAAWRTWMVRTFAALRGLPDPASLPWERVRLDLAGAVGLAGLTSVADWIASGTQRFPYAGADVDLAGYVGTARELARKAVEGLDWVRWHPPADTSFRSLFKEDPRPAQEAVEVLAQKQDRPSILVLEAPTGEGKTKASWQWSASVVRQQSLSGLFHGMPTKATSNQALGEVRKFLNRHAADLRARLLHSSAEEHLADIGRDEHEDDDGAAVAADWLVRRWGLLAPVGVGTVDQALKAAIRSRFVYVALTALSGKVLVVDEVHAYDTYMSRLLDRLLTWLGRLGVSVVLLSATLPSQRRAELVQAWSAGATGQVPTKVPPVTSTATYPRLTWSDGRTHHVEPPFAVSKLNKKRRARIAHLGMDGAAEWALAQVKGGGCAVVIHNLVRRVTETEQHLVALIKALPHDQRPELITVTGKLTPKERRRREDLLRQYFGPGGARPARAIVIGTQVLEQSLDLDFDAMASDLAPIDSVIQRMGRLWRHRPIDEQTPPVLAITGVEDTDRGPRFPAYTVTVYADFLLLRTWAVLRDQPELTSPENVSELVDLVYGADDVIPCPPGWEARWDAARKKRDAALTNDDRLAAEVFLPLVTAHVRLADLTVRPGSASRTRKDSGKRR
ncbi:CRISPR-associated helicase Cas3', partial [Amycolatopsis rhizosphaerae]